MSLMWKSQYKRQFIWLKDTRNYLYRKTGVVHQKKVLEPGCSIALITEELSNKINGTVIGLDIDFEALSNAKNREGKLLLVCGDTYSLPFKKDTFDSVIFQFFLLWLQSPISALKEMRRIVIPQGCITSIAEPDYGGRIDFPHTISYSSYITSKLKEEGADPFVGRKLEYFYTKSSLNNIKWGLACIPFGLELVKKNFEDEWKFVEKLSQKGLDTKLKSIKKDEIKFIKKGERSYFMPVFYCTGNK